MPCAGLTGGVTHPAGLRATKVGLFLYFTHIYCICTYIYV